MQRIILASTSKYRKAQLESLGVRFACVSPGVDEEEIKYSSLSIKEKAESLALAKANAVLKKYPDAIVIGGDQIAALGESVLSKPVTVEKNLEQLQRLNGNIHQLYTANAIVSAEYTKVHTEIATLKMKQLTEQQLKNYISFANPVDCAGGYKIEVGGIALFESIEVKDFNSIQGMNLTFLSKELSAHVWNTTT